MADYGYFKDIKGNKKYINDDSIYHEGKNLRDVINSKANSSNVYNKTEIDTKINNVQVLQLNLVPNEEYIDSRNFLTWGIRIGKLVYIVVEFGWKKVFENSDNTTVFISGFPTNLKTSTYVYPTDTISGHKYRMRISNGNLLNWWANINGINYGDSANKVQRLEILGYLQN